MAKSRDAIVQNPDELSLFDLPNEMIAAIPLVASETEATKIMAKLSLSRTLYSLFKSHLDKKAEPLVAKLLRYVAFGKKNEVEEMLKKYPGLLYKTGITKDPCGRTIEGTAYRVALGAKDVSISKHEEMIEMIERYLRQLPNGEEELDKQYAKQFPEGYEKQEEERSKSDSAALKKVFAAIEKSNTDEDCKKAIEKFKNHLKKQIEGVITTGYHFNDHLFAEALELYESHYDKFGGYDRRKNNLAAIKVLGSIECYFPACLAQAACDGFGNKAMDEKRELDRALLLSDRKTLFYDPRLGESHYVGIYSIAVACKCGGGVVACVRRFLQLMSNKNSKREKLKQPRPREKTPWCVVC